jgi:hypothetical protein
MAKYLRVVLINFDFNYLIFKYLQKWIRCVDLFLLI